MISAAEEVVLELEEESESESLSPSDSPEAVKLLSVELPWSDWVANFGAGSASTGVFGGSGFLTGIGGGGIRGLTGR